jgi:hypothetical protein
MKKLVVVALLGVAALFASVNNVSAQAYPFNGSVIQSGDVGVPVYQRYWSTATNSVNAKCNDVCLIKPCVSEGGQDFCQISYGAKLANGYRGYDQDLFNFGAADGAVFNSLIEMEKNPLAGNHAGYFGWQVGPVVINATSQWNNNTAFDCAGTQNFACVGVSNTSTAKDASGVPSSSGGPTLSRIGGFSPVPVPRASDIDGDGNAGTQGGVRGFYELRWDPVSSVGKSAPVAAAGYEIYAARTTGTSGTPGSCTVPTPVNFGVLPVKTVTGSQATVSDAELGGPLGANECVTFALRVRYGQSADGLVVKSRYLSANSQGFFGSGGLSATVYELSAKYAGKTNVEVSWKTSLEDGVRGFYVSRSTTQNGVYSRVSDLILAKGEASAYSFIDTIQPPAGNVKATGLWYKVETIDIDDNAVEYGPTKTQLPGPSGNAVIKQRTAKPQR